MNLFGFEARALSRCAICIVALATLIVQSARAAEPLTLDAAIERALADAPQIEAAQASLESAQSMEIGASRLPDPEVVLGVDNLPVTGADSFSLTRDFMTMSKVGLMQSVPAGAKRRYRTALAARETDVAQAELRAARFETASAAAEAWIAASTVEQTLRRLRTLREDLGVQTKVSRAALSSGRGGAGDALAGEFALARLDDEVLALEQQRTMRRADLARWLGEDASRELADLPWNHEIAVPVEMLIENVAAHPPLAPLFARIESAKTSVDLAKAERRPDWSAELSFAKRGPDYSDMVSLEFRVGLPLFAKYRQNPVIAAKLATLRSEEAQQEAALRMHRAEITSMAATWRDGRSRLEHFDSTLLPLARDRSRAVLIAFGAGRGDLQAALDALREEAELQRDFVALEGDVTRAWVFLHLLHSGGTP